MNIGQKITHQRGYILIITLVLLVVGAATWFSSGSLNLAEKRRYNITQNRLDQMEEIKQKLLIYASLTPSIMQTDSSTPPPSVYSYNTVPGPGYLPCWDVDGNGNMDNADCSFTAGDFQPRYLPYQISTRHLYFGDQPKQYYYVLDQRFAIRNANYNNGSTGRYAPLNLSITPALKLNGDGRNYVALIIYAEGGLDAANNDGDANFVSKKLFNAGVDDIIVGITEDEWKQVVLRHVCNLKDTMLTTSTSTAFWFNDYDATNNPTGSSWRSYFVSGGACP